MLHAQVPFRIRAASLASSAADAPRLSCSCGWPYRTLAEMAPIYEEVCAEVGHGSSAATLEEMRQHNAQRLAEIEEKIADAGKRLRAAHALDVVPAAPM